jgi:acetyltransferase-like isoleucine patch superfamily enzyme
MIKHYMDASVSVSPLELDSDIQALGALERALSSADVFQPVPRYVKTLRQLRKASQTISCHRDEIKFGVTFGERLKELGDDFGLSPQHFSVNTSGSPLLVKEQVGEHLISPTHFENGAYFSHPHADHQLEHSADELPSIKIGQYVRFGRNAAVNAGGDVEIGDGVWLSPGSQLLRQDHDPYGRLSIGSRTVAMTRLPPVKLCDYAWVGREAIVGWNADYLGKASIVGIRSFLNTWVGDYSIVGDQGKVLQYLPFKAHLMETYQPSIEQTLQVSDCFAKLPFASAGDFHYRRRLGYSLIVANSSPVDAEPCRVYVNELARVLAPEAMLLLPITDVLQAQLSVYQDLFHLRGEVEFDGASFMLMKKI